MKNINKINVYIILFFLMNVLIIGCNNDYEDYDKDNKEESETVQQEREKIPKSFRKIVKLNFDKNVVKGASNGRYVIFQATFSMDDIEEGEMYLYDLQDNLIMLYNSDFMCGDELMTNDDTRGSYHENQVELKPIHTGLTPNVLPFNFRFIIIKKDEDDFEGWTDDRYYIFRAIYNEYEDWYVLDIENDMFIRYEPSFMTGKEQ